MVLTCSSTNVANKATYCYNWESKYFSVSKRNETAYMKVPQKLLPFCGRVVIFHWNVSYFS